MPAAPWELTSEWPWQVTVAVAVAVAEFVRGGDLEVDLRRAVAEALGAVAGVTAVVEEDREV